MTIRVFFAAVLLAAVPLTVLAAGNDAVIKKCQDANGQWHYGDTAASECAQSTVTEINSQGVEVNQQAAPLTPEQVKAQQAAKEKAQARREQEAQQQKEDQRLLSTYESADAIIRARDERIANINKFIKINNELVDNLKQNLSRLQSQLKGADKNHADALNKEITRTKSQIADYDAANKQREQEREAVAKRYNTDLARYREITGADKKEDSAGSAPHPAPHGGG